MSLDQTTHIGAYAICTGPVFTGGRAPFEDWLVDEGREVLTTADNNTGPLVDGALIFISNSGRGAHIHVEPYESLEPTQIPNQAKAIEDFESKFADCLRRMGDDWRTVDVKFGVLSYVW